MPGLYMLFYIKNIKLLGWDKCIKKVLKKYFMVKITHKVSVMQLALYVHNAILNKETKGLSREKKFLELKASDNNQ